MTSETQTSSSELDIAKDSADSAMKQQEGKSPQLAAKQARLIARLKLNTRPAPPAGSRRSKPAASGRSSQSSEV